MPPEANYESWADKAHYTDLSFQLIMSYCDDKIKKYYLGETGNSSLWLLANRIGPNFGTSQILLWSSIWHINYQGALEIKNTLQLRKMYT